jgi:predicted amidohydrolase YtcJ
MDANGPTLALCADLEADGALPLRLRIAPWCRPGDDEEAVEALIRLQGTGGRFWRVDGAKLFMDGTVDNGTAWLERPDCHGESTQSFWPDPEAYTRVIARLHRAGVPTATHAIGDAAVRHVLDSVAKAQEKAKAKAERERLSQKWWPDRCATGRRSRDSRTPGATAGHACR